MAERYFTYGGTASTSYGLYVADTNFFDASKANVETIQVPGSNKILMLDEKTYEPFTLVFKCYVKGNIKSLMPQIRAYLYVNKGYNKIIDSYDTTEFRMGRFLDAYEVGTSDNKGAAVEIRFLCRPERFLTSGETLTTYANNVSITNPTAYPSSPLIQITGNGKLYLNNTAYLQIANNANKTITIDCDAMQSYTSTTNRNNDVTVLNGYPKLSGTMTVKYDSGMSNLKIAPRWWRL